MTEELNLESKWWLPGRENEKFQGTLTFDHQLKRYTLSIISGPNFEIAEMGSRAKTKHDIILGGVSEGRKVTLKDCELLGESPYSSNLSKYSFTAKNILVGGHFKRPEDITFSSIYVTYQGDQINNWIRSFGIRGRLFSNEIDHSIKYLSNPGIEAKIKGNYIIRILAKPRLITSFSEKVREASLQEILCIEIKSLEKKSLEQYLELNRIIQGFLNIIIPQEVHIESIYGIRENKRDARGNILPIPLREKEVEILYNSKITKMFKPLIKKRKHPIFPYNESQRSSADSLFDLYLNKWFGLSEKPSMKLYCAVMFNAEMYMEYLFLGLAEAVESFHIQFIKKESQSKKVRKAKVEKISSELSQQSKKELEESIQDCFHPTLEERVIDIYQKYSNIADCSVNFNCCTDIHG
jgi:hypothetical protein